MCPMTWTTGWYDVSTGLPNHVRSHLYCVQQMTFFVRYNVVLNIWQCPNGNTDIEAMHDYIKLLGYEVEIFIAWQLQSNFDCLCLNYLDFSIMQTFSLDPILWWIIILLVMIEIRSNILFKTIALKSEVRSESVLQSKRKSSTCTHYN